MNALKQANDEAFPFDVGTPDGAARYRAARIGLRLTTAHILRWVEIFNAVHGNDVVHALVFSTLWSNNIAHLKSDLHTRIDAIPDDSQRRPVTIREISTILGLPYETVRRRVQELVTSGLAERVTGGFIVPRSVLLRPEIIDGLWRSHLSLQRLLREADQAGIAAV